MVEMVNLTVKLDSEMLKQIQKEANEDCEGNRSMVVRKAIRVYLNSKKGEIKCLSI